MPRRAVIDVGSNSVLLLVAESDSDGWRAIVERSWVTALGEGVKQTGRLGEPGMAATLAALREAFTLALNAEATDVRAVGTMALRIAQNAEEFRERAAAQATPVEVLSGEDEAALGFLAVANDPEFREADRLTIIDVGGQSTELLTAERHATGWSIDVHRSYAIGTLGLRGSLLPDESPAPDDRLRAIRWIDDTIGVTYQPNQAGVAVALGATGTNLITIREAMTAWDPARVHGQYLDYEEVAKAASWMMDMTDAERARIVGIEPGREKSLHIGALILERFLFATRVEGCRVSVRGWRHALLEQSLPDER